MSQSKQFQPPWLEQVAPPRSYRSLYKWGEPDGFKHPNNGMYQMLKEKFSLTDADFQSPVNTGLEEFTEQIPCQLEARHINHFKEIVVRKIFQQTPFSVPSDPTGQA